MGYSGSVNSEIFLVDYNLLSILRGGKGEGGRADFGWAGAPVVRSVQKMTFSLI